MSRVECSQENAKQVQLAQKKGSVKTLSRSRKRDASLHSGDAFRDMTFKLTGEEPCGTRRQGDHVLSPRLAERSLELIDVSKLWHTVVLGASSTHRANTPYLMDIKATATILN